MDRHAVLPPDQAQALSEPVLQFVQISSNTTFRLLIDRPRNQKFLKEYYDECSMSAYAYDGEYNSGTLRVQLQSKEIVGIWKGNTAITPWRAEGPGYFGSSPSLRLASEVDSKGLSIAH
jgi:hypothetical protein